MSRGRRSGRALHVLWEYRVRSDRRREFEEHYRGDGTWARFFRAGRGYRETILLRDRQSPGRYMTIDVWDDLASYRAFSKRNAGEYARLDRLCARTTEEERCLGCFEPLPGAPARRGLRGISREASPSAAGPRRAPRTSARRRRTTRG